MDPLTRLVLIGAACVAIQACSTARSNGATDAATPNAGAGAAPAKLNRIALEDKTLTNDEVRQLFAQGYKPVNRNGQIFYCRSQQTTGSRFASVICRTGDQLKDLTRDSKDMLSQQQKVSGCLYNGKGPAC